MSQWKWAPSMALGLVSLWLLAASGTACAQDASLPDEYSKHIQHRSAVTAFGPDLFGEQISLSTGSLEIVQTDIDLPGNSALPVRMGRRYAPGDVAADTGGGHFAKWDMDIPSVHGVFAIGALWTTGYSGAKAYKRCSLFSQPPEVVVMGGYFMPDEYWHGSFFYAPGKGNQELLLRNASNAHVPTNGNYYPVVTKEGAAARCVALASTSQSGSQGEGFEVVTPDGVVYTFNHMVTRFARRIHKSKPGPKLLTAQSNAKSKPEDPPPTLAVDYILQRKEVVIYPSKVTDRFGNTVTYTWSTTNPWQLMQISASDGRHLDLTYVDSTSQLVSAVSDGTRTWQYVPGAVTFPDGSTWTNGVPASNTSPIPTGTTCDGGPADIGGNSFVINGSSPSGASVEFTISPVLMGRSWVWRECLTDNGDESTREPYLFATMAITKKTITGPGLPPSGLTWTYAYSTPNHCWDPSGVSQPGSGAVLCTAGSPVTRATTVTSPEGDVTRYTFGNRYKVDEGLLLKTDYGWNGSSALRTVTTTYADPEAAPYAAFNGNSVRNVGDYDITRMTRPQRQVTTTQQGRTFTWQVATGCSGGPYCFDTFARPTKVTKTSSP